MVVLATNDPLGIAGPVVSFLGGLPPRAHCQPTRPAGGQGHVVSRHARRVGRAADTAKLPAAHLIAAVWAAVGLAAWGMLYMRAKLTAWHGWALGGLLFVEIVRFGYGFNAQCDPSLYYPRIGALESIAKSGPGRMIGYRCLPANLSMTHGVCNVRGYDGVDPQRYIELLQPTAIAESMTIPYGRSQWATPKVGKEPR